LSIKHMQHSSTLESIMSLRKCALTAATGLLLIASAAAPKGAMSIPSALADYASWTELTPGPRLMPYDLTTACMPAAVPRPAEARKSHGPHANLWASVYGNPAALATLKTKNSTGFPAGAIIAKEKRRQREDRSPEGVAFMIKHPKGEFVDSDGWEFVYYPSPGKRSSYARCVSCHHSGASKDYVFSSLPASE
jgi:Cytochrome P460